MPLYQHAFVKHPQTLVAVGVIGSGCKWGERSGTPFRLVFSQAERRSGCFCVKNPESYPVDHPNFIYGTLSLLTSLVLITKLGMMKKKVSTASSGCIECLVVSTAEYVNVHSVPRMISHSVIPVRCLTSKESAL
jgi:hypothetical protein